MQVAMVAAGFSENEADQLRRAMATFKFTGGVNKFRDKLVQGMIDNGYDIEFANRTFRQLEGFGSYGFPESHAASFALIAYASSWMKCHHPDVFCAAILNAQPMGFYEPSQLVRDARNHGVRLGLRMTRGLSEKEGDSLVAARGARPYQSIPELARRARLGTGALVRLAKADAFASLGLSRRQAAWAIKGLQEEALPLFEAAEQRAQEIVPEQTEEKVSLPAMTRGREVVEDYRSHGLSLRPPSAHLERACSSGNQSVRGAARSQRTVRALLYRAW
jgi:error-prone DNA polymerase